jgi:tetratricopeptide (TPR) repeat protein
MAEADSVSASYLCCLVFPVIISANVNAAVPAAQASPARTLSGEELVRIGEIHDVQNHFPEALTYYEQALEAFRAHKQRKGEAVVRTKIGSILERQGRRKEAAAQLQQALALFSKYPDSPVYADALYASGRVSLWVGSREEAASLFEQAKERYRRAQNVRAFGSVTLRSALLKVSDTSPDEGFREMEQVLEAARMRRDQEQTLAALLSLGDGNFILDRMNTSRTYYEQSLALLTQLPEAAVEAGLRIRLAAVNVDAGREEQGIESGKRAVTLFQSLHDASGEAAAWALLALLHERLGHDAEADEAYRRSLAIYRQRALTVHAFHPASEAPSVPKESR